jgi:NADH dehydrogenase FAD-containing subunit
LFTLSMENHHSAKCSRAARVRAEPACTRRHRVHLLQRGEGMLTKFDPDLVGILMEKFEDLGVDVRTRTRTRSNRAM